MADSIFPPGYLQQLLLGGDPASSPPAPTNILQLATGTAAPSPPQYSPGWTTPDLTPWQSPSLGALGRAPVLGFASYPSTQGITNGQMLLLTPPGQDAFGNPLPTPASSASGPGGPSSVAQWQAVPDTVTDNSSTNPGATALGNTPLALAPGATPGNTAPAWPPGAPHLVTAPIISPPHINSSYMPPGQMANVLFNETNGQRQTADGPSLDTVRDAMANAMMNAQEQNLKPRVASSGFPDQSLLNPSVMNDWQSSFDAALSALMRTSSPGPGSAVYFNQRTKNTTDPNTGKTANSRPAEPFLGSLGPYDHGNDQSWWAFFGKEKGRK